MKTYTQVSDITVGVVGYGGAFNMGRSHLNQMQKVGMRPLAVTEIDPTRLEAAKTDFPGIETYDSLDAMLTKSDVSLITLITPHNTHAALATQCLEAGRHVVCEKPLAITTTEVDSMISTACKNGVTLSTYHNRHWDGRIILAVDKLIKEKVIGEIVRINCHMGSYGQPRDWWRSSRSISGGILYDWGVHLLEYSLQLLPGDEVTEVSGFRHSGYWQTAWKDDSNEDEASAIVRLKSGRHIALRISRLDNQPTSGFITVTGTEGSWIIDGNDSRLIQRRGDTITTTTFSHPHDDSLAYYSNVRDHLIDGVPLIITPEWSRRPIHIIDLAMRSASEGRALPAIYA